MLIQFTDKYQDTFSFTSRLDFYVWYYGFSQPALESQFSTTEIERMNAFNSESDADDGNSEIMTTRQIKRAVRATEASYSI